MLKWCSGIVVPFTSWDCIKRLVRVWASAPLTAYVGWFHTHGMQSLPQKLMVTAYSADLAIEEKYSIASAILSLPDQLIAAYELECCIKDSIFYVKKTRPTLAVQ